MQFNVIAFVAAAMATVASAELMFARVLTGASRVTTVYACASSVAATSLPGVASATASAVASTGVASAPTATGSPITYAGAASLNGVSAFGMIVAGGVALFL
ncbi:hypothetical protein LSUE1_G001563 [Lachnellula suecica]|uniref:Uncharacterized protein n=1 Tax=Lachnellula suecica TaxID=602035 RepID=A0A8T9CCK6_9HELO|nr:hypothetical protein LSUE1_G001563 [Lachnellula suecica]